QDLKEWPGGVAQTTKLRIGNRRFAWQQNQIDIVGRFFRSHEAAVQQQPSGGCSFGPGYILSELTHLDAPQRRSVSKSFCDLFDCSRMNTGRQIAIFIK